MSHSKPGHGHVKKRLGGFSPLLECHTGHSLQVQETTANCPHSNRAEKVGHQEQGQRLGRQCWEAPPTPTEAQHVLVHRGSHLSPQWDSQTLLPSLPGSRVKNWCPNTRLAQGP